MEIIGWIGAIGLLVSYYFLSVGKLHGDAIAYHAATMLSSAALDVNAIYFKNYPFVLVNSIWIIISAVTIYRISQKKVS